MIPISESKDVTLYVDESGFFSFTNSPYYAHKRLASIDLYPRRGIAEVYSPLEGRVVEARKLKVMEDYFIAIESGVNGVCAKILHVKPEINVGDHVRPGDFIRNLVWSPSYGFWTDPHMHMEVRPLDDRLRARGRYRLGPAFAVSRIKQISSMPDLLRVVEVSDRYALLESTVSVPSFTTPLVLDFGIPFTVEGGLTHYGHGALWSSSKQMEEVLGTIRESLQIDFAQNGYVHFTCAK